MPGALARMVFFSVTLAVGLPPPKARLKTSLPSALPPLVPDPACTLLLATVALVSSTVPLRLKMAPP